MLAEADTEKGVSRSSHIAPNRYTASQYAIGGACTSPLQDRNVHLLESSFEVLKGPLNEFQSSHATVPTTPLDAQEGVLLSPKLIRHSPEAAETSSSNISRAVKLGKHGRPHSQTSQEESGNISDVTRPPRRPVCCIVVVHPTTISVPI